MLEDLINKKVALEIASYSGCHPEYTKGVIVAYDDQFVKLDNGRLIAKRSITSISPLE